MSQHHDCSGSTCAACGFGNAFNRRRLLGVTAGVVGPLLPDGGCFVSTHCTGPTRMRGTNKDPEPFELRFHHGQIDPMPMVLWREGQEVTMLKATQHKPVMSIVTGTVVDMLDPKRGGSCTQMVRWKPDGDYNVLQHPDVGGHHHVLLFGNWKKELLDFCQLFKITAVGAV